MLKEKYSKKWFADFGQKWVEREPYSENIWINWLGFTSSVPTLIEHGWNFEVVTNRYTGRKKLYMRHKEKKLVGRCKFNNENTVETVSRSEEYHMEFITNEKNQFINPPKIRVENESVVGLAESDIPLVLECIAKIQKNNLRKKKKVSKPIADIMEFVKKRA